MKPFVRLALALALTCSVAASGCLTTVGGMIGHPGPRERRLALKHCDERGTPRDACPAPADHTSAGIAVGFLLDVALVAGAAYMLTPEPGPGLTLTATDRDVPLAE